MAFDSCFMKRQSKKIDAPDFLVLMCMESQKGSPSYNDLVARFDAVYNVSASKQALWKRVNESCVMFFKSVLSQVIKQKVANIDIDALNSTGKYKRVIIQDSTIIKLPLRLFSIFSGVSNLHNSVCNARIQGVHKLVSGRFIHFSIDPYSKNDLSAAPELEIRQGDLVLRDRGYYTNGEMSRHVKEQADCIYRYKNKTIFLDPESGQPINLITLLESKGNLDIEVCLNNKERTKVRLLASPVSQKIANNRRRNAKKNMKGHNPSKEVLKLMGWTIFITNIASSEACFDQIFNIYRLRWRIEIIFKIWKSHMQFAKVHVVSFYQLQVLLAARLIMIVICTQKLYKYYCVKIFREFKIDLSMMKFLNYLMKNTEKICELLMAIKNNSTFELKIICNKLIRYCSYDKRKRPNNRQLEAMAFLS